jgi:hypothetical protein
MNAYFFSRSIGFGATHKWTEGVARSGQDFELYKYSVKEKGFRDIGKLQHQHLHGGYQRQKKGSILANRFGKLGMLPLTS